MIPYDETTPERRRTPRTDPEVQREMASIVCVWLAVALLIAALLPSLVSP